MRGCDVSSGSIIPGISGLLLGWGRKAQAGFEAWVSLQKLSQAFIELRPIKCPGDSSIDCVEDDVAMPDVIVQRYQLMSGFDFGAV